eukprot:6940347-Prymnesium_polylepis.1
MPSKQPCVEPERRASLRRRLRERHIIGKLFDYLSRTEMVTDALHAIGNLASDSVDPQAGLTRQIVRDQDGYRRVLSLIW